MNIERLLSDYLSGTGKQLRYERRRDGKGVLVPNDVEINSRKQAINTENQLPPFKENTQPK